MQCCDGHNGVDTTRRKYLAQLAALTGRPTLLYASSFAIKDLHGPVLQINRQDVQFFMSALHGLKGDSLDLILHSPGGSAEAAEQIVNYLRKKFKDIRVIVPQNAMSAGTMLACAANRVVMGKHSAIGPIDPQIVAPGYTAPAKSILDEWSLAQSSVNSGVHPILWIQKINQFPPGLIIDCQKVIQLAKKLVTEWLSEYMFKNEPDGKARANKLAEWLGNNDNFLTHGRSIGIDDARDHGMIVDELEADQGLQEAVLSVFHATVLTFQGTECCKMVESHIGKGSYVMAKAEKAA